VTNEVTPHWEHWYEIAEGTNLRQGDIFRELVVYWFPQDVPLPEGDPDEGPAVPAEGVRGDWIVLTASCDLDQRRCLHVLLARIFPIKRETLRLRDNEDLDEYREVIRLGYYPSKFMLAEYPRIEPPFPLSFVEYRQNFTMPIDYIHRACSGKRLRLRHPVREKFGNWLGSCLAAVAPEDDVTIPRFKQLFPARILRSTESE